MSTRSLYALDNSNKPRAVSLEVSVIMNKEAKEKPWEKFVKDLEGSLTARLGLVVDVKIVQKSVCGGKDFSILLEKLGNVTLRDTVSIFRISSRIVRKYYPDTETVHIRFGPIVGRF